MNVADTLKGLSAYPIPERTIEAIAAAHGLALADEAENIPSITLAKADVYAWLAMAPDVSQGGQSFSFTDEQRKQLRLKASALYDEAVAGDERKTTLYGYKGSRL